MADIFGIEFSGTENVALLARLGAFGTQDIHGKCSRVVRILPHSIAAEPRLPNNLARTKILAHVPIAYLVALNFVLNDLADLVPTQTLKLAIPSLQLRSTAEKNWTNLRARPLSLSSAFPSEDIKGDLGRTIELATVWPWDRAKVWMGSKKHELHGGQDALRLHRIVFGDGSILSEDEFFLLPPHLRARFVANDRLLTQAAIFPDVRNDHSLLLSQFHARLLAYHNRFVAEQDKKAHGLESRKNAYIAARNHTIQAFQNALIQDVLPKIADPEVLHWSMSNSAPLHRRVTSSFGYQAATPIEAVILLSVLARLCQPAEISPSIQGNRRLRYAEFTASDNSTVLPLELFRSPSIPTQLEDRTLIDWSLLLGQNAETLAAAGRATSTAPSEVSSATYLGIEPATVRAYLKNEFDLELDWPSNDCLRREIGSSSRSIPIEAYFLLESEELNGGKHLGPLGSLILAETIIGLSTKPSAQTPEVKQAMLASLLVSPSHAGSSRLKV